MRLLPSTAAVLLAACATPPPSTAPETFHVPSVAAASTSKSKPVTPAKVPTQPDVPNATSWSDPEVVDRLAMDCRWRPSDLDRSSDEQRNPLSCELQFIQSCNPDPCFEENETLCKPACSKTCTSCASSCTSQCESCKTGCAADDDHCRTRCAQHCGACRQGCIHDVDSCQSTTCRESQARCNRALADEMKKPVCKAACQRASKCSEKCTTPETNEACLDGCHKNFAAACSEHLFVECAAPGRGM